MTDAQKESVAKATTVTTPSGREIRVERVFDAPETVSSRSTPWQLPRGHPA